MGRALAGSRVAGDLLRAATALVLVIELGAPWLIFGPLRLRALAAVLLAALQLFIMLTGNFAFFNILSIVLCLPLLDDTIVRTFVPSRVRARVAEPANRTWQALLPRRVLVVPFAALILALTWAHVQIGYFNNRDLPEPVTNLTIKLLPFQMVNNYGLFAVTTTERPEIVVEGSADGNNWLEYEFQYKPGDTAQAPAWVAPHQLRLDWQMWFAALSGPEYDPLGSGWFSNFMKRLLQGSPEVLRLLARNPFPGGPPRYIWAQLYSYSFTRFSDTGGGWWHRQLTGIYFPSTALSKLPKE